MLAAGKIGLAKAAVYMVAQMAELTGFPIRNIDFVIFPIPASWVMEGGAVLPEPGEEASWLAKHNHAAE